MFIRNNILIRIKKRDIKQGQFHIPDGVKGISFQTFAGFENLTSITIPDSVTSIGESAFCNCTALTSITIPDSVTSIGDSAFWGCTGLTSITIPDSVTSIGEYAFYNCTGLKSITIGNGVTSVGRSAFSGCTGLTGITIPDSVTSIGEYAFYNCTGLKSITIGNGVKRIDYEAFRGCTNLVSKEGYYKAFSLKDKKLFCRNKYFYIGKRGWAHGPLKLCENGIHFCTNLYDIFNYYHGIYGKTFVIALCDVANEGDAVGAKDSKCCARWVRPTHILTREELIALLNNPIKGGEKQ